MSEEIPPQKQHIGEQCLAICEAIKAVVEADLGFAYKVLAVRGDLTTRYGLIPRQPSPPAFEQVMIKRHMEFRVDAFNVEALHLNESVVCDVSVSFDDGNVRIERTTTTRGGRR